jgi:hypothetical protein
LSPPWESFVVMATRTIADHLEDLLAERRAALRSPLARNDAYMADLDEEIAQCRHAYAIEAVTERALARAAVAGTIHG